MAHMLVEETRDNLEILFRFRQVDVGEEGMLQPVPDTQLRIDAEAHERLAIGVSVKIGGLSQSNLTLTPIALSVPTILPKPTNIEPASAPIGLSCPTRGGLCKRTSTSPSIPTLCTIR